MKLQEVIENVLENYYTKHAQGEQLLISDLQELVDEGYLVPEGQSPYGVLETNYNKVVSQLEDTQDYVSRTYELEEEVSELNALLSKFSRTS